MTLPIDRTNKNALDANLVNGITSDAPKLKANNQTVYDTIDELYNYAAGLVASDKLSNLGILNVKDYGAKGDGVTDDITAIQTALNAVGANGGVVVIPNTATNIYLISATLKIKSNTTLLLNSRVTLKLANAANCPILQNADTVNGNSNIQVMGGVFDPNKANQTANLSTLSFTKVTYSKFCDFEVMGSYTVGYVATGAFDLTNCDYNTFENIILHDAGSEGLYLHSCNSNRITGGRYHNNTNGSGIAIDDGSYNEVIGVMCDTNAGSNFSINGLYSRIIDCTSLNGTANNGITLGHTGHPANYSEVKNCTVLNNNDGIRVLGSSIGVKVEGCTVSGNTGTNNIGIGIGDGSKEAVITGNNITNCYFGINPSAYGDVVTGNSVHNCTYDGIQLAGDKILITGNKCYNNGNFGIESTSGSKNCKFDNNYCYDDQGTPTQKRGMYIDGTGHVINDNECYGNITAQITATAGSYTMSNNVLSTTDHLVFDLSFASTDTSKTVTNANLRPDSRITLTAKSVGVSDRKAYVSNLNYGTITVTALTGTATDTITVSIS